jgi:hypothetical protein
VDNLPLNPSTYIISYTLHEILVMLTCCGVTISPSTETHRDGGLGTDMFDGSAETGAVNSPHRSVSVERFLQLGLCRVPLTAVVGFCCSTLRPP